jgi:hypothetical protein
MNFIELVDMVLKQEINSFSSFKLQSFLKQRLNEYHINETILMTFIMQNAPVSIQKTNENGNKVIKRITLRFLFFV